MDRNLTSQQLEEACKQGDQALSEYASGLGFSEPSKTATNLTLIREEIQDCGLLASIASDALETSDPDLALNSLERLLGTIQKEELLTTLNDEKARKRLLVVLGASPFLTGILCRKAHFFSDLFSNKEFERSKDENAMLEELRHRVAPTANFAELQKELRIYKSREVLRIGSRDLCTLADLVEVTSELSALASSTLQRAYETCDTLLRADYGAPLIEDPEEGEGPEAEFTVMGMGKFGGRELNFSSDIDLIYFYSTENGKTPGPPGAPHKGITLHQYFCKLSEMITKAIGQVTEDGFVFRVDLRLRPEGNSGEMASSLRFAEVYYESWGQSWERSAMLKARPVAGSIEFGEALLKELEPFIYRKHLDYGMVEDIKLMKQKIDQSLTREKEGELNLKLGKGGIREIEFFIQALQLIYGGKKPKLREKSSLKALALLQEEGLVKEEEGKTLREAYTFLRETEHRIQVVQERQTHNLPKRPEELEALGRRCGFAGAEDFGEALATHRSKVYAIYRDLFYTGEQEIKEEVRPEIRFLFDSNSDPDGVKDLLEEHGFKNVDLAYDTLLMLRDGPPHSYLTARTRRQFERITPLFMQEVMTSPEPDMAMLNLERFLSVKGSRSTFCALLAENPAIIKVLTSLFGTSQFLSRIFIQHPESLDALAAHSHTVPFKDRQEIEKDLSELLATSPYYEDQLDLLRRFRNEEFLRLALNDLEGADLTTQLSFVAEACLKEAYKIARRELLPRFGVPFQKGTETEMPFGIIGMGKLGGMELNFHSDLDIIFIYEGKGDTHPVEGTDESRFRSLSHSEYFAKLAQRIISILTLITRQGAVYEIDTRLRPSGNQGPLVTSLAAFEDYHESSAQLWERQALTKGRTISEDGAFADRIDGIIKRLTYDRPLPDNTEYEIRRLRSRMEKEIAKEDQDHLNIKTGRGGLVDVEFIAQYLQLKHGKEKISIQRRNTLHILEALGKEGLLDKEEEKFLDEGYRFLRRLENKLRLVHDQSMSELSGDKDYLSKLAKRLGYPQRPKRPEQAFLEDYKKVTENIRTVFERLLGE